MKIKILIMDVDGTLTDGKIYMGPQGEAMKAFHCKDGLGIAQLLPELGIVPVIITGRRSQIVKNRAGELKISHLFQGISDKLVVLDQIAMEMGISRQQIAYIGDDLNDLTAMQVCGLTSCPADAVEEIKQIANYVCQHSGGDGAVREFIDYLRKYNAHQNPEAEG